MEKKKKNFFRQHLSFTIFLCLAIGVVLVAILAPVITGGVSPTEGNLMDAVMKPCKDHIFGTDKLGRDIFTRVIYGTRISVTAAFSVVIIISVVGTFLGILAGYFGGIVDAVIMRISDMMIASS